MVIAFMLICKNHTKIHQLLNISSCISFAYRGGGKKKAGLFLGKMDKKSHNSYHLLGNDQPNTLTSHKIVNAMHEHTKVNRQYDVRF